MRTFIDQYRHAYGVEPICKVMQVAPSGYRRHAAQQRNTALRCARVQRDDELSVDIERVWQANMQVYGAEKVWRQLRREGTDVARCTVERLMRKAGLRGVMRGKVVRTTIADAKAQCPLDRGQPSVQGTAPEPAVCQRFHVRLDVAGFRLCRLRHRRLRSAHRWLARQQFDAD